MKERPIIFTSESVKAILEGKKTQTRRVIKSQPFEYDGAYCIWKRGEAYCWGAVDKPNILEICPYGQVGDRLWVKETWATENRYNHLKPSEIPQTAKIFYLADGGYNPFEMGKVRSALFIPRQFSRITLENTTDPFPQRVQEITRGDAMAEGYPNGWCYMNRGDETDWFAYVWDSLNIKRGYGWETNLWVWVISFIHCIRNV